MSGGNAYIDRRVNDWSGSDNPKIMAFLFRCLLMATDKPYTQLVGNVSVTLQPGEFVFGRKKFSKASGLTEDEVRTCLKTLLAQNILKITREVPNHFKMLKVCCFLGYGSGQQPKSPSNPQPIPNRFETPNRFTDKPPTDLDANGENSHNLTPEGTSQTPVQSPTDPHEQIKKEHDVRTSCTNSATKRKSKPTRERDPFFDGVATLFGFTGDLTRRQGTRVGMCCADFKAMGCTLENVKAVKVQHETQWSHLPCTMESCAKNYLVLMHKALDTQTAVDVMANMCKPKQEIPHE